MSKCSDCKYNSGLCKVCIKDKLFYVGINYDSEKMKKDKLKEMRNEIRKKVIKEMKKMMIKINKDEKMKKMRDFLYMGEMEKLLL